MRKKALAIACLLLLFWPMRAIERTSHYATVGAHVGAAKQQRTYGPEGGLAVGYALMQNHLLFHASLEASFRYTIGSPNDYTDSLFAVDAQNDPYLLRLAYTHIHTANRALQLALPLRLGGQWERFYFTLGPAFSLSALQAQQRSYDRTATADYSALMETFVDMPNHGLKTTHFNERWTPVPVTFGIDAALEIGWIFATRDYYFSSSPAMDFRLAAYANIGLWRNTPFLIGDHCSAGIRLSIWLRPPHHYPCRCFNK